MPDGGVAAYRYDGLGRRIEKNVSGTITRYVYDEDDLVLELNGRNEVLTRYTHGPEIDEPLIVDKANESFSYHADALGSIVGLTDAGGSIIQSFSYDAFGRKVGESGSLQQLYSYTGREIDRESGDYYYRARYYDPSVGRFVSEDPLYQGVGVPGEQGKTEHLYLYTENNPINYNDPTGLFTVDPSCNEKPFNDDLIRAAAQDVLDRITKQPPA